LSPGDVHTLQVSVGPGGIYQLKANFVRIVSFIINIDNDWVSCGQNEINM